MKYLSFLLFSNAVLANILPISEIRAPKTNKVQSMTESEFNTLIDKVTNSYIDTMPLYGSNQFKINKLWDNNKINASARKKDGVFELKIYGGLGRFAPLTTDGFILVLCHEIGHLIGGAPTYKPFNISSSEGQADYFATTKCFKRVLENEEISEGTSEVVLYHPLALSRCANSYKQKREYLLCLRSSKAQESLALTMSKLGKVKTIPSFDTPDPYKRTFILFNGYPSAQCRLDTMFAGSICNKDQNSLHDFKLYNKAVCSEPNGDLIGVRPKCWYVPRND